MKQKLLLILLLATTLFSCNTNHKTQEQLRVECDSLLDLASNTLKEGFKEIAVDYCNQAISIDSTYWKNYSIKGVIFYYNQNYDSAVIALEKMYYLSGQRFDTMPHFMYLIAHSYQEVQRYDEALMIAQKGLLTSPDNFKLIDMISTCYGLQNKYDLAEKWAIKALNTHNDDSNAYFRLAWIYQALGRKSKAIEYYKKRLELKPKCASSLWNLSILYWDTNYTQALALRKKAAQLGNEQARKWCKENGYDY